MKLTDLKSRGAFVGNVPQRKTIQWSQIDPGTGERVTDNVDIFVRPLSFGDVERIYVNGFGGDDRSRAAALICARVLLGENAEERLSYEEAYSLEPGLGAAMIKAIEDVGEPGEAPKN